MPDVSEYADKVVHVSLSGKMLNGGEIWQTGFFLGWAEGEAGTPTQATADGIRDAWSTFFADAGAGFHPSYSFEEVKLARLTKGGRYDGTTVIQSFPALPVRGTRGGSVLPPQLALVATLVAGSGKGLAGKGRMYLPGINYGVDETGHISMTDVQRTADKLKTFFDAVRTIGGPEGLPINASKGSKAALYLNARNVPINGVRVGNVYDTQRRRRNGLQETYAVSGLIGG